MVQSLELAGADVDALRNMDAIQSEEIAHRYVFVDVGDCERANLDRILERTSERTHIALIVNDAPLGEFTKFLSDPRINHIINEKELERGVFVTAQKLLSGDIFGIERYIPEGTPVHYIRLNDFAGRVQAIETVQAFAAEAGMRKRLCQGIGQVCEELLMNALYDAPVDEHGTQLFAEVDPHERVESTSPKPVSIRYAATENQFAIAVRDRYGRLAKNTIIAYINKCLTSPDQIDRKTYGAGLGLYLVANAAASYVVNVAYDVATEVICTFDRKTKLPLRLVGVFTHPREADKLYQVITPAPEQGGPTPSSGQKRET